MNTWLENFLKKIIFEALHFLTFFTLQEGDTLVKVQNNLGSWYFQPFTKVNLIFVGYYLHIFMLKAQSDKNYKNALLVSVCKHDKVCGQNLCSQTLGLTWFLTFSSTGLLVTPMCNVSLNIYKPTRGYVSSLQFVNIETKTKTQEMEN